MTTDHRIGEINFDLGAETGRIGAQFTERIADRDLHRLQHLDETARCRLRQDTCLINRSDKSGGAAVHDRNFRAVDFDRGVIDAHAAQGREHMFGGGDDRTFAVAQDGSKFGSDHRFGGGLDFAVAAVQPAADKNKTCIHGCRSKSQTYR